MEPGGGLIAVVETPAVGLAEPSLEVRERRLVQPDLGDKTGVDGPADRRAGRRKENRR